MKIIGLKLALPAVLAIVVASAGRTAKRGVVPNSDFEARLRSNIGKPATGYRAKVFVERMRCRGWQDSNPNTLRINCEPSPSAGERIPLCSTCRMC
jgi:hypothetical protein